MSVADSCAVGEREHISTAVRPVLFGLVVAAAIGYVIAAAAGTPWWMPALLAAYISGFAQFATG